MARTRQLGNTDLVTLAQGCQEKEEQWRLHSAALSAVSPRVFSLTELLCQLLLHKESG